jgi:hypothetical protein
MNYIKYQTTDGTIHENQYDEETIWIDLSGKTISGRPLGPLLRDMHRFSSLNVCKLIQTKGLYQLLDLNLSRNSISKMRGFSGLVYLERLKLSSNKITWIGGLDNLKCLQLLDLSDNLITKIRGLDSLESLQVLRLGFNRITKMEGLGSLKSMQELNLSHNLIAKMEGLGGLTSLERYLDSNNIAKIEGFDGLARLVELQVLRNNIDKIPTSIINLGSLRQLYCDVPLNPIIERFLNGNRIKSQMTIYNDKQNVHDSQINKSITESLYRLLDENVTCTDSEVLSEVISDPILSTESKAALIEYSKIPDVHSQLNVTFMEVLKSVWSCIRKHKQSAEIKKILDQEMRDSICKCQTGRLSRLVNTLSGFDGRVSVRISDSQEISNVIIAIRQKNSNQKGQRKMITNELVARGYSKQVIDEWLVYLE